MHPPCKRTKKGPAPPEGLKRLKNHTKFTSTALGKENKALRPFDRGRFVDPLPRNRFLSGGGNKKGHPRVEEKKTEPGTCVPKSREKPEREVRGQQKKKKDLREGLGKRGHK